MPYHRIESCAECGAAASNDVTPLHKGVSMTECRLCGHKDTWVRGYFQQCDTPRSIQYRVVKGVKVDVVPSLPRA